MEVLAHIATAEWEFTIGSKHVDARLSTYSNMLAQRKANIQTHSIIISPEVQLTSLQVDAVERPFERDELVSEVELLKPIFFDNAEYQFELVFLEEDVKSASIVHPLKSVGEAFRFASKRKHSAASLIGTINTGNDIGQLVLPVNLNVNNVSKHISFTLEVLSTKMQLDKDLPAMYRSLDEAFPLWRFSLAEKTEQGAAKSRERGNFPLLWLAQFKQLRESFELGLKVVANAPHNRLQRKTRDVRAERLKGRLSKRLAERVREDIERKDFGRRYQQDNKQLSVDTPENRFIKMVVISCKQELDKILNSLQESKRGDKKNKYRLSEHFLEELQNWQKPLLKIERSSFLKEVGKYNGQQRESLVLQQKTGYSKVYKVWQELKYYLNVFANESTVSMKSVSETYEVWCFLELRRVLIEILGFNEVINQKAKLRLNDFFELQLNDGLTGAGAFEFERDDGLKARLAHEPVFLRNGNKIKSYWVTQKPDIYLEVTFPNGRQCVWLFDAKYRIKNKKGRYDSDDIDNNDFVPDDAINQMHRYRDALIKIDGQNQVNQKSRPVLGAFALYPGFYNQLEHANPYDEMINEVGIGAFALLPSDERSNSHWLQKFLRKQLDNSSHSYPANYISDDLYINEPLRIPYSGMRSILHNDLALISRLGDNRSQTYIDDFSTGNAQWFHIPVSVFDAKFGHHVVHELRYLAVVEGNGLFQQIHRIYRIANVTRKLRSQISLEQSGVSESEVGEDVYWLFELAGVWNLNNAIECNGLSGFRHALKLASLTELQNAHNFEDITPVYEASIC